VAKDIAFPAPEQMVLWDAVVNDPQKQMIAGGQLIDFLN
jgi:hypothetical protein